MREKQFASKPEPPKSLIPEPGPAAILAIVGERPMISLQELCERIWPLLTWEQALRDDLMFVVHDDRTSTVMSPARWLQLKCQGLIHDEELRLGPFDRRRPGIAGLTYRLPGSLPPILLQQAVAQEVAP